VAARGAQQQPKMRRAQQSPKSYPWLAQLLARRPFKVVAIALGLSSKRFILVRFSWCLLLALFQEPESGIETVLRRGPLHRHATAILFCSPKR